MKNVGLELLIPEQTNDKLTRIASDLKCSITDVVIKMTDKATTSTPQPKEVSHEGQFKPQFI